MSNTTTRLGNILDNPNFANLSHAYASAHNSSGRGNLITYLETNGITSAMDVTNLNADTFILTYGNTFQSYLDDSDTYDGDELADEFYNSAVQIRSLLMLQYYNIHHQTASDNTRTNAHNHDTGNYENLPSYSDLFGEENYLEVPHDESVLSAAAYLTDLYKLAESHQLAFDHEVSDDATLPVLITKVFGGLTADLADAYDGSISTDDSITDLEFYLNLSTLSPVGYQVTYESGQVQSAGDTSGGDGEDNTTSIDIIDFVLTGVTLKMNDTAIVSLDFTLESGPTELVGTGTGTYSYGFNVPEGFKLLALQGGETSGNLTSLGFVLVPDVSNSSVNLITAIDEDENTSIGGVFIDSDSPRFYLTDNAGSFPKLIEVENLATGYKPLGIHTTSTEIKKLFKNSQEGTYETTSVVVNDDYYLLDTTTSDKTDSNTNVLDWGEATVVGAAPTLDLRRPDLADTSLTAEATNTEVPTITLVNNAMESLITDTLGGSTSLKLSDFPPSFDKSQQQIGKALELLGSSLAKAREASQSPTITTNVAGWMHWNISVHEYNNVLTTAATSLSDINTRLGLSLSSIVDITAEDFMDKANVSITELKEALEADATRTEQASILPYVYINNHTSSTGYLTLNEAAFSMSDGSDLDVVTIDRLYRLIRMSKLTGIGLADMHWLLSMAEFEQIPSSKVATDADILADDSNDFCAWVAAVQELATTSSLNLTKASAQLGYIKPYGQDFGDYASLWFHLFGDAITASNTWSSTDDQKDTLSGVCNIRTDELLSIINMLSLDGSESVATVVHTVFRLTQIAQQQGIEDIDDLITFLGQELTASGTTFSSAQLWSLSASPVDCLAGFVALQEFMDLIGSYNIAFETVLTLVGEGEEENLPNATELHNIQQPLTTVFQNADESADKLEDFSNLFEGDLTGGNAGLYLLNILSNDSNSWSFTVDGATPSGITSPLSEDEGTYSFNHATVGTYAFTVSTEFSDYHSEVQPMVATIAGEALTYLTQNSGTSDFTATNWADALANVDNWNEGELVAQHLYYTLSEAVYANPALIVANQTSALFGICDDQDTVAADFQAAYEAQFGEDSQAINFMAYVYPHFDQTHIIVGNDLGLTNDQSRTLMLFGKLLSFSDGSNTYFYAYDVFKSASDDDQLKYPKALHRLATLIQSLDLSFASLVHIFQGYTSLSAVTNADSLVVTPYQLKANLIPLDILVKRYQHNETDILAALQPSNIAWVSALGDATAWEDTDFVAEVLVNHTNAWNPNGDDTYASVSDPVTMVTGLQTLQDYWKNYFIQVDTLLTMYATLADTSADLSALATQLQSAVYAKNIGKSTDGIENALLVGPEETHRDALIATILHTCSTSTNRVLKRITNANALSEYMLTDVQVESKVRTSEVVFAISAIQTLINRTLHGFEAYLDINDTSFGQTWSWMRHYRTWEANRKIFLHPENYLDPQFLPSASDQYEAFVATITASQLSDDVIQTAYKTYLNDVAAVNKMELSSNYFHQDGAHAYLYLLAKSNDTHKFYVRSIKLEGSWSKGFKYLSATAWADTGIPVTDSEARIIYSRGRVFVFYLEFMLDTDVQLGSDDDYKNVNRGYQCSIKYTYKNLSGDFQPPRTLTSLLCQNKAPSDSMGTATDGKFTLTPDTYAPFLVATGDVNDSDEALYRYPSSAREFQDIFVANEEFSFRFELTVHQNILVRLTNHEDLFQSTGLANSAYVLTDQLTVVSYGSYELSDCDRLLNSGNANSQGTFYSFNKHTSEGTATFSFTTVTDDTVPALYTSAPDADAATYERAYHTLTENKSIAYPLSFLVPNSGQVFSYRFATWFRLSDNDNSYNIITNILDATRTSYTVGGFSHSGGYLKFTGGTYGGSSGKLCKMSLDTWYYLEYTDKMEVTGGRLIRKVVWQMYGYASDDITYVDGGSFEIDHGTLHNDTKTTLNNHNHYFAVLPTNSPGDVINVQVESNYTGGLHLANALVDFSLDDHLIASAESLSDGTDSESLVLVQKPAGEDGVPSDIYLQMIREDDTSHRQCIRVTSNVFAELETAYISAPNELLSIENQFGHHGNFEAEFSPNSSIFPSNYWPTDAHIDLVGDNAAYFRELFMWTPLLIARIYNQQGDYESAQAWLQKVFNPTLQLAQLDEKSYNALSLVSDVDDNDIYWSYIGLRSKYNNSLAEELFGDTTAEVLDIYGNALGNQNEAINTYVDNPYDPDAIAALRPIAYQKYVVIQYVQNLIDWGDHYYKQLTREDIATAYEFYQQAFDLAGLTAEEVGVFEMDATSTLGTVVADSGVNDFLVGLEGVLVSDAIPSILDFNASHVYNDFPGLIFGIPRNTKFETIQNTLEQRFINLRAGKDINGNALNLPLFSPSVDPGSLVRANSRGALASTLANGGSVTPPYHRFHVQMGLARDFTQQVIRLNDMLLSVARENDAEQLAQLSLGHQANVLSAIKAIKQTQVDIAKSDVAALEEQINATLLMKAYVDGMINHYQSLKNHGDDSKAEAEAYNYESGSTHRFKETTSLSKFDTAHNLEIAGRTFEIIAIIEQYLAANFHSLAAPLSLIPRVFGFSNGGFVPDGAVDKIGSAFAAAAFADSFTAGLMKTEANYKMRTQEWLHQSEQLEIQIAQLKHNYESVTAHYTLAMQDQALNDLNISQQQEIIAFYQNKYTNQELFKWMQGQLTTFYKQAYNLAVDQALKAQMAFEYEKGMSIGSLNIVNSSSWNSKHHGHLAAESLLYSLQRLEQRYLKEDFRRMEITEVFSLAERLQNDSGYYDDANTIDTFHDYLVDQGGTLTFSFGDESDGYVPGSNADHDFDKYYAGHYCRQIKMVSVSIPSLLGPYKVLHGTLSQTSNKLYIDGTGTARQIDAPDHEIAISMAMGESGMHGGGEGKYLPFEGTGVDSSWRLTLADELYQVTDAPNGLHISDIIITMHYTALK